MTVTIPTPQRINNKLTEEFYPLQKEELMKLREVKLINNAAYVHLALRYENPFCDRPVQVIPKEFALRWGMPESSVYSAIAKLKKIGILNIKSGKLVIDWVKPKKQEAEEIQHECASAPEGIESDRAPENIYVANNNSETTNNSQIREKILRSEKKFSDPRKNSQIRENRTLKPLSDIASDIPQTLQNIQTNQTRGGQEKTFSQEVVQKLVQKSEVESKVTTDKEDESIKQTTVGVVQKKTKIISPSKNSNTSIPEELVRRLEELSIPLDNKVRSAIASHHISQAYGAATHVENTWDSINNPRSVFLYQLPKQPVEQLGSRHSEEILKRIKATNEAIDKERSDPSYFEKTKSAFAEIKAKLARNQK